MEVIVFLIFVGAVIALLVLLGSKPSEQETYQTPIKRNPVEVPRQSDIEEDDNTLCESDMDDYTFYSLVGMKYHKLSDSDLGRHDAIAVAEPNNKHSRHAVAILRRDTGKKVGYISDDESEDLFEDLMDSEEHTTLAKYEISKGEVNYYGEVEVKEL